MTRARRCGRLSVPLAVVVAVIVCPAGRAMALDALAPEVIESPVRLSGGPGTSERHREAHDNGGRTVAVTGHQEPPPADNADNADNDVKATSEPSVPAPAPSTPPVPTGTPTPTPSAEPSATPSPVPQEATETPSVSSSTPRTTPTPRPTGDAGESTVSPVPAEPGAPASVPLPAGEEATAPGSGAEPSSSREPSRSPQPSAATTSSEPQVGGIAAPLINPLVKVADNAQPQAVVASLVDATAAVLGLLGLGAVAGYLLRRARR